MCVRVFVKRLKWPTAWKDRAGISPEVIQQYESHRVLHYTYQLNAQVGMRFHLLCEVGEPWQAAAKGKLAVLLKANPGYELRSIELPRAPWYVEALVKTSPG